MYWEQKPYIAIRNLISNRSCFYQTWFWSNEKDWNWRLTFQRYKSCTIYQPRPKFFSLIQKKKFFVFIFVLIYIWSLWGLEKYWCFSVVQNLSATFQFEKKLKLTEIVKVLKKVTELKSKCQVFCPQRCMIKKKPRFLQAKIQDSPQLLSTMIHLHFQLSESIQGTSL